MLGMSRRIKINSLRERGDTERNRLESGRRRKEDGVPRMALERLDPSSFELLVSATNQLHFYLVDLGRVSVLCMGKRPVRD